MTPMTGVGTGRLDTSPRVIVCINKVMLCNMSTNQIVALHRYTGHNLVLDLKMPGPAVRIDSKDADPVPSPGQTGTKGEPAAQSGGRSAAAAPPSPVQKEKPKPAAKSKTEHVRFPLLNHGISIKYTNPENKGFFGKTGSVILHRGAMVHLNFGKDGTCWGHRKYCEIFKGGPEAPA